MKANYIQRLRLTFSKNGPARYIGHLDLARTLERSFNRAKIPVAYTQGFNPRPRMAFAAALPLGFCSEAELVDLWLAVAMEPQAAREQMMQKMVPGIIISHIIEVPIKVVSLQAATRAATYAVTLLERLSRSDLQQRLDHVRMARVLNREWKRGNKVKEYDLRPLILELDLAASDDEGDLIWMKLLLETGKTGRPDEVLRAMDLDPNAARITRKEIILDDH
ncbi:MAG: TIGR03936 family radical SAM-associated protein [Candidatus Promineifilaceae bacterium]|nr:TIGR03936 family radical SAM-associated protein [Candidatus Promineifilaceae bacterium]